jgi:hypothetical protein
MTAGKKATAAEVEERVTKIYSLVIHGANREEILRYGSAKWKVTTRQVEEYLARATKRFVALAAFVREEELGKVRERLEFLYGRNVKARDFKAAHQVLSDTADLLGLYAPKQSRTELTGPGGGPIQLERVLPDDELAERLRLALESRGEGPALPALDPTATRGN